MKPRATRECRRSRERQRVDVRSVDSLALGATKNRCLRGEGSRKRLRYSGKFTREFVIASPRHEGVAIQLEFAFVRAMAGCSLRSKHGWAFPLRRFSPKILCDLRGGGC